MQKLKERVKDDDGGERNFAFATRHEHQAEDGSFLSKAR